MELRLMLVRSLFWVVQLTLWLLCISGWRRAARCAPEHRTTRFFFTAASQVCATICLLLLLTVNLYMSLRHVEFYDYWELKYIGWSTLIGVLGIILGIAGKRSPRLIALSINVTCFLLALLDATTQ